PGKFPDDAAFFAREKELVADRLALCEAVEKGQKDLNQLAAYPPRVQVSALMVLLEPGRERSLEFGEQAAGLLAEQVEARDEHSREALAELGLGGVWAEAARDPEALYRLARSYAWCASRTQAEARKGRYAGASMYYLQEARKAGFRDAGRVKVDRIWEPLKDNQYFPPDLRPTEMK